jgi:hypothetical protein
MRYSDPYMIAEPIGYCLEQLAQATPDLCSQHMARLWAEDVDPPVPTVHNIISSRWKIERDFPTKENGKEWIHNDYLIHE